MNHFTPLAILETLLLLTTAALPGSAIPSAGLPLEGYLQHALSYLLYGILLAGAFRSKNIFPALLVGAAVGLLTETIQLFVPGRFFDLLDWAADMLGTLAGAALFTLRVRTARTAS